MPMHNGPLRRLACLLAAVLCLAGCGATATLPAGGSAASSTAAADWPLPGVQGGGTPGGALLYYAAARAYEAECVADLTALTAFPAEAVQELDAFCAAQGPGFSVSLQDLATGESYTYDADTLYYAASLLKVPYALWLCQQADAGSIDLGGDLPNLYSGQLAGGHLAAYDASATVPVQTALEAMLTYSDNHAVRLLANVWPLDAAAMAYFLQQLGCPTAQGCAVTTEGGLDGYWTVQDATAVLRACYLYFQQGSVGGTVMQRAMRAAPHRALYFPPQYSVAKKYGSWDGAFHDIALCYAPQPYLLVCMTGVGDRDVDFPPEQVQKMQDLGRLAARLVAP